MTTSVRNEIEKTFVARTPKSRDYARRASLVIPGANTSQASYFLPYELTFPRAEGSRIWDLDGNEYLDFHNRFTTLVHGHRFPPIVRAVDEAMSGLGTGPSAISSAHVALAELLVSRIASADQVRLCNSGTEAVMLAVRLARRVTGRPLILKAGQGFHGWYDEMLVGREYPSSTEDTKYANRTLVADFDDPSSFEEILTAHGDDIAIVILEPVLGAGGILPASRDFFSRVAAAARRVGALLVADEVITFRLNHGGAQASVGLEPDMTVLGKVIGGGFPIGAVAGGQDLMAALNPYHGPLQPHFGTFNANPVTCAAGFASVSELTTDRIQMMDQLGQALQANIEKSAAALQLTLTVSRVGSLLNIFFELPPLDPTRSRQSTYTSRMFHLACLNHGILIYPRGTMCLSSVMTPTEVEEAARRIGAALSDISTLER